MRLGPYLFRTVPFPSISKLIVPAQTKFLRNQYAPQTGARAVRYKTSGLPTGFLKHHMKYSSEAPVTTGNIILRLEESKYYSTLTNPLKFTWTHSLHGSISKLQNFKEPINTPEENYIF